MLESASFRTSKRSRQFLRYVVEQALDGHLENLKERSIGIEVFERRPAYDTSEDATVRVTANEVRKRLAQYHLEIQAGTVRIDLPPGSYVPGFQPAKPVVEPPLPVPVTLPASKFSRRRLWTGAVSVLAVLGSALFWLRFSGGGSAFDAFWNPVRNQPKAILVCLAHPVVYVLSERVLREYFDAHPGSDLGGPISIPVDPRNLVPTDIIPVRDQYVGAGDAYASSQFMALFSRFGKSAQLRIGNDISFADLRNAPAVLIGAYSNRWTMQANAEYRFAFAAHSVIDRSTPGRKWQLTAITPDYKSDEDFAIISRVFHSHTGETVITAAGITNYGTQAAAEFLTSASYLNEVLAHAPAGWQNRNFQLVLHCRVTGSTPGPPKVVASHFW
ncbi:MAG: hypothetical protein NTY38_05710 [Acidobacteria bacterium]|nr:hypothetical protein [Acidobacteriota bacterium]